MAVRRLPFRLFFLLPLFVVLPVRGDIFASVVDLKRILIAERTVVDILKEYVQAEAERLRDITDTISQLEEQSQKALEEPDVNLSNIVYAFQTISRLHTTWQRQHKSIFSTDVYDRYSSRITALTEKYPSKLDLRRAAESIFRLQDVYQLQVSTFADGSLAFGAAHMSAADCMNVGIVAYEHDDFYHSTLWLEHAVSMVEQDGDRSIELAEIYDQLAFTYFMGKLPENLARALELAKRWTRLDKKSKKAKTNLLFYGEQLATIVRRRKTECNQEDQKCMEEANRLYSHPPVFNKILKDWEKEEEYIKFGRLCRGEGVYNSHELYCSYKRHHPLFVLIPLKEELLRIDPHVAIYHDLITSHEADKLRAIATPKLGHSTIFGTQDEADQDTHIRTSKTAWVPDTAHSLVQRVSERSVAIGNLSIKSCDEMQVVCYGLGGHYNPHFDWAEDERFHDYLGNRVATVIHYLADVEAGGYTVFLDLGVRVAPKKGDTLFWWNLKRNCDGDKRNLHAGCPVLHGNKWIANKWVHIRDQAFTRPCTLNKDE